MIITMAYAPIFLVVVFIGYSSVVEVLGNNILIRKPRTYTGFPIGKVIVPGVSKDVDVFESSGEFAFMAEILKEGKRGCGAVIIRADVVLTAAHCMKSMTPDFFTVRAGTYDAESPAIFYSQTRNVVAYVNHPLYNPSKSMKLGYDISVVFLEYKFELNKFIKTIKMARYRERVKAINKTTLILGWGETENHTSSKKLLATHVLILDMFDCREKVGLKYFISDSVICTLSDDGTKGPCTGDSGGPLIRHHRNKTGSDVLLGIVGSVYKTKTGDCLTNRPAFYTDVSSVRNWILRTMENATHIIEKERKIYRNLELMNKK